MKRYGFCPMVKLGVNIDHIALVRQARGGKFPDPVEAARIAESAGADGITVHLREDRRHIQDEDVKRLHKSIRTKLNLEMAATEEMVQFACRLKPSDVCLVPEKRKELTTEGGLNVLAQTTKIKKAVERLKNSGICVSIFIDPDPRQIEAASRAGADAVELHTGTYANAVNQSQVRKEFNKLANAALYAVKYGLILNAGHGLGYNNVVPVAKIEGLNELNIGYSIVVRSLYTGLAQAVRQMKSSIR